VVSAVGPVLKSSALAFAALLPPDELPPPPKAMTVNAIEEDIKNTARIFFMVFVRGSLRAKHLYEELHKFGCQVSPNFHARPCLTSLICGFIGAIDTEILPYDCL
jgi:hypothetical protein